VVIEKAKECRLISAYKLFSRSVLCGEKFMSQTVETRVVGVDLKSGVITVEYLTRITTTVTTTVTVTRTKTLTAVVATAVTRVYTHSLTTVTTVISTNTTLTVIEGGESVAPVATAGSATPQPSPAQAFVPPPLQMPSKSPEAKPQPIPPRLPV
jgi:hypothetical protein